MRPGPVLIAYDGTAAAERALRETSELLPGRKALVVVVYKTGLVFELVELPTARAGLPPAPLDMRNALEVDRSLLEAARRGAEQAAATARELGLEAEPLVVTEDAEIPVDETLVSLARERDAQVVIVGAHKHGPILGRITRGVVRNAPCPALVVREM